VRQFARDFRKFILRGNVIDLAVAVVVGAAFTAVVQSFANDVLMGFIGALFAKPNFNHVVVHVGDGNVAIGKFITQVVNFLIVAFAVFMAVKLFEKLQRLRPPVDQDPEVLTRSELLLTEIRDSLAQQEGPQK
jgi:large conductance mechanosensitive channel